MKNQKKVYRNVVNNPAPVKEMMRSKNMDGLSLNHTLMKVTIILYISIQTTLEKEY